MNNPSLFNSQNFAVQAKEMQNNENAELEQQITQLENAVKTVMTPEARSRYTNIKLASPSRAIDILVMLAQIIQTGKAKQIDDVTFKSILTKIQPQKKTTIIRQ